MGRDVSRPGRQLTLVELVFNYGLFVGGGYWGFGKTGAWIGAGVLTARYAYLIWVASRQAATDGDAPAASEQDDVDSSRPS